MLDPKTGALGVARAPGKLSVLEALLERQPLPGQVGIGHTRWATHGRPSEANAHPHRVGGVAVVHNGIIENYLDLKRRLQAAGREFSSETDTEIVAHLIDEALVAGAPTLVEAVRRALVQVVGAYALVVVSERHPGEIVAAKNASPLVIGLGVGETFLASDVPAILEHTRDVIFMDEGEIAELTVAGVKLSNLAGEPITRASRRITWDAVQAEKGGYPHFMLKEIHEQPRAIADTLRGRLRPDESDADLDGFTVDPGGLRRVILVACGTSYHAGLVGKVLDRGTGADPVRGRSGQRVSLSQSRRRAQRFADRHLAKWRDRRHAGGRQGSQEPRLPGAGHLERRGFRHSPDRGRDGLHARGSRDRRCVHEVFHRPAGGAVAVRDSPGSSRAERCRRPRRRNLIAELAGIPAKMTAALASLGDLADFARVYRDARDFLFIGRGTSFPIALEGALKLKEISYIHAEGYAAGEMKHGPDCSGRRRCSRCGASASGPRRMRRFCRIWCRCGRAMVA